MAVVSSLVGAATAVDITGKMCLKEERRERKMEESDTADKWRRARGHEMIKFASESESAEPDRTDARRALSHVKADTHSRTE